MGNINWKSAILAGLISGVIMMMLEMILAPLFLGGSPWGPPRMIAAIILGKEVLPPPADFDLSVLMAAMMLHLMMSVGFAIIIAFFIKNLSLLFALAVGAAIGLALYFLNFYLMADLFFPWFNNAQNWVSAFSHVSFGIGAAWAYKGFQKSYSRKQHFN